MIRRPPRSTRTDTLFPYTTLFRSEHALARTERKSGRGYRGFVVDADPTVTLQQDLQRRDFTINAIAEDGEGQLIDPFDGARDIERRVLRHVSDAFPKTRCASCARRASWRSEEHTSELQSLLRISYAVFCLK